ncbi:hypothetical protein EDD16DRAFT_1581548 [Pisolithus croceorrhizus]|nr:hypothetical protein EDD16DRAFT_1581548 [Pisolithus croceorrhizus]
MSSSSRPARPTRPVPATPEAQQDVTQIDDSTAITPIRAHYLKKSLIQLQLRKELDDITNAPADNASTLAYLGPPFSPPPNSAQKLDLPFLRYMFSHFVLTFPFMAAAPKDFYSDKLQPFVASVFARNLSPTILMEDADEDETAEATRLKILAKVERNLTMLFSSSIKLAEPEQVVRLSQSDLDRLERLMKNRRNRRRDVFDVNIVCIRTVTDKGRVRSRVHEEFIIRTRLSEDREVCVSRRYGDFKTLADELRKAHPDELVPFPPAKNRTAVDVASPTLASYNHSQDSLSQIPLTQGAHYNDSLQYGPSQSQPPERLSREKNRLTLRAYLHTLLANPTFASSPVLRSFLLSNPTRLTPTEQGDARRREEADHIRDESRRHFAREISIRIDALRESVRSVKGEIIGKDGLMHVFSIIKVTPNSLPQRCFQTYVASDNSSETFASLKRIHGLMPYFLLKAALKISNPVGMIRGVLDIFLAQPFGGRSLLQRMFTSSLSEEVKSLSTYIEHVSDKVGDAVLCDKVRAFVYAPREVQDFYRASAVTENVHLLHVILHGSEEPVLDRAQLARIDRAGRKWEVWERERKKRGEDSDDEGPSDEDVWLFEDLRILMRLQSRLRDREQLIALIFEVGALYILWHQLLMTSQGVTAELLKDIITIFYAPLAQVYRAASIADSLGDLQNFINDLIRTVEQTEDRKQDPTQTVQAFVDLVSRHEQAFYTFVHKVHSKVGTDTEVEKAAYRISAAILEEVDQVVRYHYALKVVHEERVRRQFWRSEARGEKGSGEDADAATTKQAEAFAHSVAREIGIGELTSGNENEILCRHRRRGLMMTDEDDEKEDSSEFETDSQERETSEESLPSKQSFPKPIASPTKVVAHSGSSGPAAVPHTHSRQNTQPFLPRSPRISGSSATYLFTPERTVNDVYSGKDRGSRSSKESNAVPPVPPLPPQFEKPLPPARRLTSGGQLSVNGRASSVTRIHASNQSRSSPAPRKAKKNASGRVQPPELKHIPLLLPVFVEMVSCPTRHQDSL